MPYMNVFSGLSKRVLQSMTLMLHVLFQLRLAWAAPIAVPGGLAVAGTDSAILILGREEHATCRISHEKNVNQCHAARRTSGGDGRWAKALQPRHRDSLSRAEKI